MVTDAAPLLLLAVAYPMAWRWLSVCSLAFHSHTTHHRSSVLHYSLSVDHEWTLLSSTTLRTANSHKHTQRINTEH
uniref:Putative secreted protein n=1 Tax=Anopheles marajoara TaxID=58244 RepID=A0A2M4CCT1_9DIPT